jgi:6-phosphogluconolactonase (cycloisomerase 2 family)
MKSLLAKILGALLVCLLPLAAEARIEAPDHVIYGSVTIFGTPAAMGMEISARTLSGNELLASYRLGRFPRLGSQYALRIPMDVVNPRLAGRARPGDPIRIFVGSQLAAETVVGAEGVAVRLDLDPQNMGAGPSIRIDHVARFEGNEGTTPFEFPVFVQSTGSDWNSPATIEWHTVDVLEGAIGGSACVPGVDYISVSGATLDIQPQAVDPETQVGTITVLVCGDTEIEPDETFEVHAQCFGCVLVNDTAIGTIIDDDNVPELRFVDIYVSKPQGASSIAEFEATLSRSSAYPASFSYQTADASAVAGIHYLATSGSITFAAGEIRKPIAVTLLPHAEVEPEREFRLQLSAPLGLSLQRDHVSAFIIDPRFEPVVTPDDSIVGGDDGVPGLVNPTAIVIAPEGRDVYVVSESGDRVMQFERDDFSGGLTLVTPYTASSIGLEGALLDAPRDLLLSPDGAHLYVAARSDSAVNVLARDAVSGALGLVQTRAQGQSTAAGTITGLAGAMALAMSPDGRHLYAAGPGVSGIDTAGSGVAVFLRDPVTGSLEFVHAILSGGSLADFERPSAVVVSADGSSVYVSARGSNALHTFSRNQDEGSADFGRLAAVGKHKQGTQLVDGLNGAFGLGLSADDRHLYLAGEASNSVVWFERDLGTGLLDFKQAWKKGPGFPGLGGPMAVMVSEDQGHVMVPGFADNTLSIFERMADGSLSLRQTLLDSQSGLQDMLGPMALADTVDGRFVYVVANVGNAIVRLRVTAAPEPDPTIFSNGFEAPGD